MKTKDVLDKIKKDPDFIALERFDCSLKKMLDRYPDGVSNKVIARALMMTEEDVEDTYQHLLGKIRTELKVDLTEE